ncbi:MAG: trypsin-like serine protease, partial [Thermoplasmatota archaeon]
YIGVAAHCFGEDPTQAAPVGTQVDILSVQGVLVKRAGTIAYNGWQVDFVDKNDFGLVELRNDAAVRGATNPTVLYYGGPTALASAAAVTPGTHVITYGHSVQRAPDDPENPREGYVLQHDGGRTTVVTNHPGIQGDSGSGLMTKDGEALGVLSMGTTNPSGGLVANRDFPSVNYYIDLDQAVQFAQGSGPTALKDLEIVTAPLLNGPVLPL